MSHDTLKFEKAWRKNKEHIVHEINQTLLIRSVYCEIILLKDKLLKIYFSAVHALLILFIITTDLSNGTKNRESDNHTSQIESKHTQKVGNITLLHNL